MLYAKMPKTLFEMEIKIKKIQFQNYFAQKSYSISLNSPKNINCISVLDIVDIDSDVIGVIAVVSSVIK